jgi:hypothetical protein
MNRLQSICCCALLSACAGRSGPAGAQPVVPTRGGPSLQTLPPPALRSQPSEDRAIGRVTVAIVVDQLASWVASVRLPLLPQTGGFARLIREGTWYKDVRFAHAITDTAPGHASLYSGTVPRENGIVSNEVLTSGRTVTILLDPNTKVVTTEGVRSEPGSSALALQGDVVADRLRKHSPTTKVYSFSLKDRGAIFGGGYHPDVTLWFDTSLGGFVSSTAFTERLPDWILPLASSSSTAARIAKPWTILDMNWVARSITGDDQAGEGNLGNYGSTFPHLAKDAAKPSTAYRANPDSDRLLLELGLLAIDHTPRETPIFLALSLSANDYIGHIFGPDSWEAWDELGRLDSALGWFFSELDRRQGADHWSVVLSADHGIAPLPEVSRAVAKQANTPTTVVSRPMQVTERVLPDALGEVARQAAAKTIGKGDWVAGVVDPYLYLSDDAKRLAAPKSRRLRQALISALMQTGVVEKLLDMANLPVSCPSVDDESFDALVCRSAMKGRGGDYLILLKSGHFFDTGYVPGFGTSHGNADLCDRSVPLLVRAPGVVPSGKVEGSAQSFVIFSHQLQMLLGIP